MLGFIIGSLDVNKIFYGQHTGIDQAQYTTSPESFHASSKPFNHRKTTDTITCPQEFSIIKKYRPHRARNIHFL